jgi:hypothetical protein
MGASERMNATVPNYLATKTVTVGLKWLGSALGHSATSVRRWGMSALGAVPDIRQEARVICPACGSA